VQNYKRHSQKLDFTASIHTSRFRHVILFWFSHFGFRIFAFVFIVPHRPPLSLYISGRFRPRAVLLCSLPPSRILTTNMSAQFQAFLGQTRVTVDLDPSSPTSSISLALAHALNLPCIFTESGHQTCSTILAVPTVNGFYRSRLDFVAGYDLPTDVVLGNDWMVPCEPIQLEGCYSLQQPTPHLLDDPASPHRWYPVAGLSPFPSLAPCAHHTP